MFRLLCFFGLGVLMLVSCSRDSEGIESSVTGKLTGMTGEKLVLEELKVNGVTLVDSVILTAAGDFRFELQLQDAGFYLLRNSAEKFVLMLLEPGEAVEISWGTGRFEENYHVTGSPGTELLRQFAVHMARQKRRIDSLSAVYDTIRGGKDFEVKKAELDLAYSRVVEDHISYVHGFVDSHPGSLASLIVINRSLGQARVIDEEQEFYRFWRIDSALTENYPNNEHTVDHHKRVIGIQGRIFDKQVAEERVMPGKKAPDLVLPDTAGTPFSLKSYSGKPVILYFWAGWNGKSRQDNRRLAELVPAWQRKGIRVVGVSLDENSVVWKGAIRLDRLDWKQLSDLNGLLSPVKKDFNLPDDLPFYYLLDEKLMIRFKNNNLDSLVHYLEHVTLLP